MAIASLRIADFRNLSSAFLAPCEKGLNIIYGNNGSGKTSLLEAIHYLSVGRSFRGGNAQQLIRHQANKFVIFAQLVKEAARQVPVGIEREVTGSMRLRIAEKDITSMTELAAFLPVRIINSHSHRLFEAGPEYRRKFIDWGLFYQHEHFLAVWRHFERALQQRNSLLKEKRSRQELNSWTETFGKYALELTELRQSYMKDLTPYVTRIMQMLLNLSDLHITYLQGWEENKDFESALSESYPADSFYGHTQLGPHRADLSMTIGATPVKHFLSRGQQKLLVCAMILAQGMMLAEHANKRVVYLVDDLPSELDGMGRKKLISLLADLKTQTFITAIEKETISDFIESQPNVPYTVFHVEHGRVVKHDSEWLLGV